MTKNPLQLNSRYCAVISIVGLVAIIFGCSKKDQPPSTVPPVPVPVAQQLVKPVQKTVSSSVKFSSPPTGNLFDFSNKKDPFKPFVLAKAATGHKPSDLKKAIHDALPIHSFDVSQFRLIGVVVGGKENQAMVVDPNGKGYVLKVGMSIGKNDGRISLINAGGVNVLEQFKDDNGRVRRENIRITLPRKQ